MKVVINRCWGGFSLSPKAVKRMAEIKGQKCYFFTTDIRAGLDTKYISASIEEAEKAFVFWAFSIADPNKVIRSDKNWLDMTAKEREERNNLHAKYALESRPGNRSDPALIQAVEELGRAANGPHAELSIVEIPDGISWEIDDYDGMERVEEVHRSWA